MSTNRGGFCDNNMGPKKCSADGKETNTLIVSSLAKELKWRKSLELRLRMTVTWKTSWNILTSKYGYWSGFLIRLREWPQGAAIQIQVMCGNHYRSKIVKIFKYNSQSK